MIFHNQQEISSGDRFTSFHHTFSCPADSTRFDLTVFPCGFNNLHLNNANSSDNKVVILQETKVLSMNQIACGFQIPLNPAYHTGVGGCLAISPVFYASVPLEAYNLTINSQYCNMGLLNRNLMGEIR